MVIDPGGGAMPKVLTNVQTVVTSGSTMTAAGVPLVQTALVWVQPTGRVSLTLKLPPAGRLPNVWLTVPPTVVTDVNPKLLVNAKVPSPLIVFFTTVMDPGNGGIPRVFTNVQTVVTSGCTITAAGIPFVHVALLCVQPIGSVSLTLKPPPAVRPSNVWLAVPPTVVRDASPKLLVNANVPFPFTVFLTTWMDPEQTGVVMLLVSRVTAPLRASKRPFTVAPVLAVIDDSARMLPWKFE